MVFQMISDHSIFTWRVLSLQWNERLVGFQSFLQHFELIACRERFFGSKFQGIGLLAPSVICFKGLGDVEQIRYENVGLRGNFEQEFKPTSPHSMCVQLIMRHLPPNHKYFHEHESRFEALLGYLNSKEGKRHAFTIILVRTGLGQYRRLVQRRPIQDLQVIDLDDFLASAASLSVTDVLIFNPRPILPPKSYASRQYVPIALNCATAIKTGVEIGGCWGEEPDDVKAEEISGEKNYIAVLWRSDESRGPWRNSIAFTVRNMKSGKICGLILVVKDWETIDVSIVYDLAERDFKERDFFDSLLERHSKLKSQNLVDDVISYKLSDGSHLFLSCENQEILCGQGPREIAQTRLEDLNIENLTYQEVRDILCQGAKAQLRVGIIR